MREQPKYHGISGGAVFRASAGFGRHGVLREETFFELADGLPAKVEFLLSTENAGRVVTQVRAAGVDLVYALIGADFGILSAPWSRTMRWDARKCS